MGINIYSLVLRAKSQYVHTHTHSQIKIMKFLSLALIGYASADLSDFLKTKEEANQHLSREKRGLDPDTFCGNELKAPKCWEEFAEVVWKPRIKTSKNMVSRKEGWPLYKCVKLCTSKDGLQDFVGTAYEEKREKREEHFEAQAIDRKFITGCPQCCEFIPDPVRDLAKVQKACPNLSEVADPTETAVTDAAYQYDSDNTDDGDNYNYYK